MAEFEFARDAGAQIFDPGEGSSARRARLLAHLAGLRLAVSSIELEVDGETVTLRGQVDQPVEREKLILAAGNVARISRVDDRLVTVRPGPPARFHVVAAGETLATISAAYCGDAARYPAILEANRPMLQDPDGIYPGQVLRIPSLASGPGGRPSGA